MKVKKLLAGILSAAMALGTMAVPVFAENDYTVSTAENLKTAAENITDNGVITIKTGSYEGVDFVGKNNITIQGENADTTVTISKLDNYAMFGLRNSNNITIKNINFVIPENFALTTDMWQWTTGVIGFGSDYMMVGNTGKCLTVENCTFTNNSEAINNAIIYDSAVNVKNSKFTNFEMAIRVLADGSPLTSSEISKNTFTNVNEPVNAYWGGTDENAEGKISFTSNTVESAKDSDKKPIISIWDYANSGIAGSTIKNITLSDNTYNTETLTLAIDTTESATATVTENVVNTYSSAESAMKNVSDNKTFYIGTDATATEEIFTKIADYEYVDSQNKNFSTKIAKIGSVYYTTINDALQAATNNDTVTLLADTEATFPCQRYITNAKVLDLNGKKLTLNGYDFYWGEMTFKNGTIDITADCFNGTAIFWQVENKEHLTFDDVTVNANSLEGCYLIGNNGGADTVITLNNSTINSQSDVQRSLAAIFGLNGNCKLIVNNSKVNVSNIDGHVIYQGNTEIKGDKSEINANKVGSGVFLISGSSLTVSDSAVFKITDVIGDDEWNSEKASIVFYDGNGTFQAKSGKYSMDVSAYCESGYTAAKIGDMYEVLKEETTSLSATTVSEETKVNKIAEAVATFDDYKTGTTEQTDYFTFDMSGSKAKVIRATYNIVWGEINKDINADIVVDGLEADGDLTLGIILYNIPSKATVEGPTFSTLQ